jgi:hydrogenase maturation factor
VGAINLICWFVGIALIVVGYTRAKGPWARYQELKAQEANLARYDGWRGTRVRDDGPSAASIMAAELRRKAQIAGLVAIAGFVLVFVGFAVH